MLIFTQVLKKFSRYSTNDHEVGHKNYSFENLVDKRSIKRMISYVPNEILPMKNIGCLLIGDSRIPPSLQKRQSRSGALRRNGNCT